MKRLLLFIFVTALSLCGWGQKQEQKNKIIEERVELLIQDGDLGEVDFTTLFDDLELLYDDPINLNTATAAELKKLPLLNDVQVYALLRYRKQFGQIYSLVELQYADGFDKRSIEQIRPFVTVAAPEEKTRFKAKYLWKYGKNELILRQQRRLESSPAYNQQSDSLFEAGDAFDGSPDRLYARYRYRYRKNVSFGFTGEKDPGEAFGGSTQPQGFDFLSGHIQVADLGLVKNVVVGDFQFQAGQGLTFWSGFGYRKSPQLPTLTKRYERGFTPYTSAEENRFLRGGAATIGKDNWEVSGFYSRKKVDANRIQPTLADSIDEVASEVTFSSIQSSGFHRTIGELADKDLVEEQIIGARASVTIKKLKVGVTAFQSEYEGTFAPNRQLYQSFQNNSGKWQNAGLDYDLVVGLFNFFGEVSLSEGSEVASLTGLTAYLNERFTFNALYRHYPLNYQSFQSNAFGEKGGNNNERGLYLAADVVAAKGLRVAGYYDVYAFPWLSYQKDGPSIGYESALVAEYEVNRKTKLSFMYRHETDQENPVNSEETIRSLVEESLSQYRLQLDYQATKQLRFRTRMEYRDYQKEDLESIGFMIYQDVYYDLNSKWGFKARFALYETDDYNSRIYAYENDMRYQFTVPAYYDQGSRTYLLIDYRPIENLTFYLRYAQTYFSTDREIGQNPDTYFGRTRSELKTQLILKF